ncbi:Protein ELYS [Pleurostoma richardsiae]|uniref:Protein ELYS n=1 Tax=Pleurostoma richardsiae TaxID=41990 RepID=A0AA38RT12_9PEZI|nr:Protein ELYS [Pleurostoma richardsiae]
MDYTKVHEVFGAELGTPYDQDLVRELEVFRKSFHGVLFIDRVLKALGVAKAKAYPPRGESGLHTLHQQICESGMTTHHKLSVFYYLLLDFDDRLGLAGAKSKAARFAEASGLPRKYQIFMEGLWYMDRQRFPLAVEFLCHPSLLPEFADDIIAVLVRHAENNDYSLALAYFHAVQPVLRTSAALELLFGALARTSVTEAFYFSRTHPESTRQQLFHRLISAVLDGRGSQDVATRASELVSLPLQPVEERWFEEYLTAGDGRKLKKSQDTLVMRKVITGRHDQSLSEKSLGGQWGIVFEGFKNGLGGRIDS